MNRKILVIASITLIALWLASCSLLTGAGGGGAPGAEDMVNTYAAQTVSALGTKIAAGENPTLGPNSTLIPTETPTVTASSIPLATVTPTPDGPCNQASFIKDVTIPDGSMLLPNSTFTKTWEIKNTGSCAWNNAYAVVFANRGTAMSGAAAAPFADASEVKPGETTRVSVTMRAPNDYGSYEGYWQLRAPDGQEFGTGKGGGSPFFVKIVVGDHYSFAEQWCSAKWSSGAGDLPCPGIEGGSKGYVLQWNNPTMEDNKPREGLGLLTIPQPVAGGEIVASFPAVVVPDKADFRATVSCQRDATGCYVLFRVTYRVDGGDEQLLGDWSEGYDGSVTEIIKDLNMVSGRSVAFSLYVFVKGAPDQAKAVWFDPKITK